MTRLLLKKFMRESSWLFAACGLLLSAFILGRTWIICQFDLQQFASFLDQLKPFEKYMPVPLDQILTYSGSLAMTFSEPMLMLPIVIWSIARGSDVVSGELGRGTLEMLLAQPVGRTQLIATHALASTVGLGMLCVLAWTTFHLGIENLSVKESVAPKVDFRVPFLPIHIPIPMGQVQEVQAPLSEKVDSQLFAGPCVNLFCFGFVILCLSIFWSAVDRFRWRAIGVTLGIYVVQLLLFILSKANTYWLFTQNFTFVSLYQPERSVMLGSRNASAQWAILSTQAVNESVWPFVLGPLGMCLCLAAIGIILLVAAVVVFKRRDLPAPM